VMKNGFRMDDLIEAMQIFRKYCKGDEKTPIHCQYDELNVCCVDRSKMSEEDVERLGDLSFMWTEEGFCFYSFRFGSSWKCKV